MKKNHKAASVIMIDAMIDMYEAYDRMINREIKNNKDRHYIEVPHEYLGDLIRYMGCNRRSIIRYRNCFIAKPITVTDDEIMQNYFKKLWADKLWQQDKKDGN